MKTRAIVLCVGVLIVAAAAEYASWPPHAGPGETPDRIVVLKSERRMILYRGSDVLREYKVAISRVPVGAKTREGDHKIPEGVYTIDAKNPASGFHLALHVSYPNAEDRVRANADGVRAGGDIEVHGIKNGLGWLGRFQRWANWTNGCVALTDPEIEQVYKAVPVGTRIEIRP
jgi:murein L,D-transpeptidase YafK